MTQSASESDYRDLSFSSRGFPWSFELEIVELCDFARNIWMWKCCSGSQLAKCRPNLWAISLSPPSFLCHCFSLLRCCFVGLFQISVSWTNFNSSASLIGEEASLVESWSFRNLEILNKIRWLDVFSTFFGKMFKFSRTRISVPSSILKQII